MGLSLRKLRMAAQDAQRNEKTTALVRSEIRRIFGPSLRQDRAFTAVIEEANNLLATPRYREEPPVVKTSVACHLAESPDPRVRLFAAHVMPDHLVAKLAFDKDPQVRHAVAWRASLKTLDEMTTRWPHDDQLEAIVSDRGLLSEVKLDAKGRYQKVGDAGKQWEGPELTEQWYHTQVSNLLKKYANNLEYCWEEVAVRQFVNAYRSSTGVRVDEKKLYDMLKERIQEREEERLEALDADPLSENPLQESIEWLKMGGHRMNQPFMPVLDEDASDPVQNLLDEQCSSAEYIRKFNALFSVRETPVPAAAGKYRLGEARSVTRVPVTAHTPAKRSVGVVDERALDRYCRSWNEVQKTSGISEPLQISWSHSPQSIGDVNFDAILR